MRTFFLIAQPSSLDGTTRVERIQADTVTKARHKADQFSKKWQTTVVLTEYHSHSHAGFEPRPTT